MQARSGTVWCSRECILARWMPLAICGVPFQPIEYSKSQSDDDGTSEIHDIRAVYGDILAEIASGPSQGYSFANGTARVALCRLRLCDIGSGRSQRGWQRMAVMAARSMLYH